VSHQRLNYQTAAPHVLHALLAFGRVLERSSLEPALQHLVELRVSQINRCAFCIALHTRQLEALGERGDRVSGLTAWHEAPWYSPRERAALEWAESLTRIADEHPDDALYERVKAQFTETELAELTLAICAINTWNRFSIGFSVPPEAAEDVFRQLQTMPATAG
jgi:AhpD family alkylhydroperoxidase